MSDPVRPLLTVLFYGDPRAADWPPPDLPGFTFVNRGVPGQSSSEALRRWSTCGAPVHPDIVVLQIGINDLTAVSLLPQETKAWWFSARTISGNWWLKRQPVGPPLF